jgi:predicted DNA-binding transcriptional regulator AlpA
MTGREILTAPQVARLLARSVTWFYRNRATLEGKGFPRPVDGLGMRWDSVAIHRWLDAQAPAAEASAEDVLIARALATAPAA